MWLLARLYRRRIINVNVNILLASGLALAPTVGVVHLLTRLEVHHRIVITVVTLVADVIFDALIYFVLHWVANHMPWRGHPTDKPAGGAFLSFIKGASPVQFERATLSPVLYGLALLLQHRLIGQGVTPEAATAIGFAVGILSARVLHTIWMFRQDRRAARLAPPAAPIAPTPPAAPVAGKLDARQAS